MTGQQLIDIAGQHWRILVAVLLLPPVLAVVVRAFHDRGRGGLVPWKYLYSLLVYFVCIPGILAAVLTAYALFFTRKNLLDVNLLVYGLPLVSMGLTLFVISRAVAFSEIPGFGRLSGLMTMLAVTFALTLALARTRIWLLFGGSIFALMLLVGGLFALLQWGAYMAFRRRDQPARKPRSFPKY